MLLRWTTRALALLGGVLALLAAPNQGDGARPADDQRARYHIHEHAHGGDVHTHGHSHPATPHEGTRGIGSTADPAIEGSPPDDHHCCEAHGVTQRPMTIPERDDRQRGPTSLAATGGSASGPIPGPGVVRRPRPPPTERPPAHLQHLRTVVLLT